MSVCGSKSCLDLLKSFLAIRISICDSSFLQNRDFTIPSDSSIAVDYNNCGMVIICCHLLKNGLKSVDSCSETIVVQSLSLNLIGLSNFCFLSSFSRALVLCQVMEWNIITWLIAVFIGLFLVFLEVDRLYFNWIFFSCKVYLILHPTVAILKQLRTGSIKGSHLASLSFADSFSTLLKKNCFQHDNEACYHLQFRMRTVAHLMAIMDCHVECHWNRW